MTAAWHAINEANRNCRTNREITIQCLEAWHQATAGGLSEELQSGKDE